MSSPAKPNPTRIPSVDVLLSDAAFAGMLDVFGRNAVLEGIRSVLSELRQAQQSGSGADLSHAAIAIKVDRALTARLAPSLKQVFNLTGTILHTNLGRSPLPDKAIAAMNAAAGSVNLEYDLTVGARGQRDAHVTGLITSLTGAEAATVVNNNAAAVLIALNTFALGREVVVSRGELIEIGGAFRLPDIMVQAGCKLREVGTTNRTHLKDYKKALGPDSALILKAHTSNYKIEGFTKAVPESDLTALARAHTIPFIVDLGSGTLVDLKRFGLPHEATVRETLENGADLVTFSGDKLLGGPQAGIIAGRKELIAEINSNPMKRAMRLDKITLAALGAVLRLYLKPENVVKKVPALTMLNRPLADIRAMAERIKPIAARALTGIARVEIEPCRSQIGSGSVPTQGLESCAITLRPMEDCDRALRDLASALRALPSPVIGRMSNGKIVLDIRALREEKDFLQQLGPVDVHFSSIMVAAREMKAVKL